ncbi:MAG: hypothetical protein K2G60_06725 [Oscillospiraceae bacterium]|nr:hypothetical protein [Oscillospiraceae bacterium]
MEPIQPYPIPDNNADFHDVVTVTLGELIEGGMVDWDSPDWTFDSYNEEQRQRLCEKIENRYYFREIGILPPGRWKREFLRKLNEIMPKYKLLYAELEKGVNILQDRDEYGKARNVFSDFPATQLGGENQDYATNGTDAEFENVRDGNYLDRAEQLNKRYNDVDVMILNEMESMFSSLMTVSMNGY